MQLDYLSDPRYSVRNLSDAIINIPNEYSLLTQMGLFPDVGIRTTYVEIEIKNGELNIIPTSQRGAPAPQMRHGGRSLRALRTLFMQLDDYLRPSDLQNLPAFGTPQFFESFDMLLAERSQQIQAYYRQTHEYMKWGALRGNVYDADGTTVLYNCYTEMGESQQSIDFKFGTTAENGPLKATTAGRRYMETNALGEPISGIVWLCSATFIDKVIHHPYYKTYYDNQQLRPHPFFDDVAASGFHVGGNFFMEHNGTATYKADDGTTVTHSFIPANEAIGIPLGTRQVFRSYFAPGEMMDTVNLPGQAMYVSMKELDHGRGIEIHTESAPLFLVQKPRLVLRGYSSN
ncbi:MAG: major capsid protein [Hyphomicrobiaceae bacterium]